MLGFDFVFGAGAVVRMFALPFANACPPLGAGGGLFGFEFGLEFFYGLIQFLQNTLDVADDRDIGHAVLADLGGIDIHMNDAGVTGEGGKLAGDAIVKTGAEGDEQVAFGHPHVGGVTAVHPRHADEIFVAGGKTAERHEGADGGEIGELDQFREFFRSLAEDGAASSIDPGALSFPDQLGGAPDLSGMTFGEHLIAGEVDGVDGSVVAASLENVLRDIDEHGTGTAAGGDVEGFVNDLRQLLNALHHEVVFRCRARDAEGIGLLEGVAADELRGDLAGDSDDGDGIHHGVNESGDEVGGARAGRGAADAHLAGGTRVAFGGETGILFVAHEDVADVAVEEGVVEGEGDAARIAEEAVDAFAGEAFEQDFSAVHQLTGFVHNLKLLIKITGDETSITGATKGKTRKRKKGHQLGFTPLMASDLFRLPEASDGDGYNDPDNNNYVVVIYDGEGRGNSACEAVEHCQKY